MIFEIRQLVRDDAQSFRDIRLEALSSHPEAFGSSFEDERDRPELHFADWLESGHILGGWTADGTLGGVIGLSRSTAAKTRHIAVIWGMYVRPSARGSGLSRGLISAAIDAGGSGVRSFRLGVVATNEPAIRLYKSLGFQQWAVEVEALKVGDVYHDELLMRLDRM